MRNYNYLDNETREDRLISELMFDNEGNPYRLVNGEKIIQLEEKTQYDIDMNLILNISRITDK